MDPHPRLGRALKQPLDVAFEFVDIRWLDKVRLRSGIHCHLNVIFVVQA
jgi:hypothetical protein